MNLAAYTALAIDGMPLTRLALNGQVIWQRPVINMVAKSINADGTPYNGGKGYKDGYRVRSGGAEATSGVGSCTGYIPVQGGDVVRISGCDFTVSCTENAINASSSSFTNLGQLVANSIGYGIFAAEGTWYSYSMHSVVEESPGVWRWIVPPAEAGIAYIRVTGHTGGEGSRLCVTVSRS